MRGGLDRWIGLMVGVLAVTAGCTPGSRTRESMRAVTPLLRVPVPGAPAGVTALVNVDVIPMDTARLLSDYTVLVEGGWITALGPASQVRVPAGAARIDGRGKFLLPGLADMHAHLETRSVERRLLLWLASGVTTVRSMFGDPAELELRARAAAGELASPRIYVVDQVGHSGSVKTIAEAKASGYDFIKFYSFKADASFDSLAAEAHRIGLPIVGHVPPTVGLERVLGAGYASIEHFSGYLDYLTGLPTERPPGDPDAWGRAVGLVDSAKIAALAVATQRAGVWICPTLVVWKNMHRISSPVVPIDSIAARLQFELKRQLIKPFHDAGVRFLLGTDPVLDFSGLSPTVAEELQELVAAGLSPYQALETGTRNVAEFLGALDSTGTVAVGKRADLVLLEGNPLLDIRQASWVAGVLLGGRWLELEALKASVKAFKAP